jgi:hypothetical protein
MPEPSPRPSEGSSSGKTAEGVDHAIIDHETPKTSKIKPAKGPETAPDALLAREREPMKHRVREGRRRDRAGIERRRSTRTSHPLQESLGGRRPREKKARQSN